MSEIKKLTPLKLTTICLDDVPSGNDNKFAVPCKYHHRLVLKQ